MSTAIDHKALAISRLATQYKESANLTGYIKALLYEADNIEQVLRSLLEDRWVDTATGINLDIIGSLVGQSREFINAEIFEYFGFADNPIAQTFGSTEDSSIGGRFVEIGESTQGIRQLTDNEYRLFIRGRILVNSTASTPEEIISQLKFLFNIPYVVIIEGSNTSYQISFGRVLSINEKAILQQESIIPKTIGVGVYYVSEVEDDNAFAFQGIPGSRGFGSVNNAELGGKFGKLIF